MFIARLSDGGILQWIKRFGQLNTPKDTFWEVVEADDGGIVAVGSKLEDREFYFYDHFWFLKVDADGNEVWSREIGTNDRYDMAFDVIKMKSMYGRQYMGVDRSTFIVNDQGKIMPRRITGTSAKMHRKLVRAIKRSRSIALMPYVENNSE